MRQTGESERESGGNNDAERERTSESEIEDLGAQLDKACASRPRPRATWHDPPYRSNTPSDRGALAGHRRHPAGHAAAHAAQQPRRQTVRAAYRRADAVAGHAVFDYCDHRDSRPCNRRTRPARHRQRGVRGRANRLALGLYQAAANDFRRGQQRSHAGLVQRLAQHVRPVRPHHDLQRKEGHADANRIVEIVKNEHVEVLALRKCHGTCSTGSTAPESPIICRIPWPRSKRGMTTAV